VESTHNEIVTSFIDLSVLEVRTTDSALEVCVRLNSVDDEIEVSAENAPE
jgi:hypothetical protein